MQRVYASLLEAIGGGPNTKVGVYHLNMHSTTCYVYCAKLLGAPLTETLPGDRNHTAPHPTTGLVARDRQP